MGTPVGELTDEFKTNNLLGLLKYFGVLPRECDGTGHLSRAIRTICAPEAVVFMRRHSGRRRRYA
jgi:hypothetical protein